MVIYALVQCIFHHLHDCLRDFACIIHAIGRSSCSSRAENVLCQEREVQVEADLRLRSQREAGVQCDMRDRAPDPSVLRRSYYDSVKFYRAVVRRLEDRLSQAETCWR